ncbi:hypothetical protein ACLX1H_010133 [Fusarium chlamydosporum]
MLLTALLFSIASLCVAKEIIKDRNDEPGAIVDQFPWFSLADETGIDPFKYIKAPAENTPETLACTTASLSLTRNMFHLLTASRNPVLIESLVLLLSQDGSTSLMKNDASAFPAVNVSPSQRDHVEQLRAPREETLEFHWRR